METVADYFGCLVFNDETMRLRLPKDVYRQLMQTVQEGKDLDLNIANAVAHAMKCWALENGCSYYTHWFQPMTGITAEKHESFIRPVPGGKVIMEFSGKELVKGEPDASSFPSGGLRATFEARGYTAWDPTSYAFIKDDTLCIPTAFCSYSGEVLDKKTPLLRSMEAISNESLKILHLFGNDDVKRVGTTVGPEQEYFLIDKEDYSKREDLVLTGRTLLGARSPKGQEMNDHYFGAIRTRVSAFMHDLDKELWKLGINSKTSHNEVAPCQHEMAPVYCTTNVAVDHNQLTMELMKKIAEKHGLACLLHEKPFKGVNGSGKHNNWSLSTDTGENLLDPGDNPRENIQFLLFLTAVIKAVDEYQDLLRLSAASAGNDHRLGASEAPPAIVSIFIGSDLEDILDSISFDKESSGKMDKKMGFGVHALPYIARDTSDRNRTSPMAFTGNKFEFRMLGSSFSVSGPNIVLNTIVANSLSEFYEELKDEKDIKAAVLELIKREYAAHKRIIFNGNNYSEDWVKEAENRGLLNLRTAPEAYDTFLLKKNMDVFAKFHIYSAIEIHSRYEIVNEEYSKTIHIEALTMIDMIRRMVLPAVEKYTSSLALGLEAKFKVSKAPFKSERQLLDKLSALTDELDAAVAKLDSVTSAAEKYAGSSLSHYSCKIIIPEMDEVRRISDEIELLMPSECWPYPTYAKMLYYI